ncbi:mevalonate kinase [Sporosarcina sp. FA9]|uniref:mevalonate kinase n=1 Tax=Sporosarcina sp. FA9 TaxID=3413030 RepID=UPI003F65CC37
MILIGEHSVVYGKPAIAIPFPSIHATATVENLVKLNSATDIILKCHYYEGRLKDAPLKLAGIVACIHATIETLEKNPVGMCIHLNSTIPIGRGLGSSAAVAIAIVKSLYSYYDEELSQSKLMELVHIAETHAHGNPSGIDMVAASSEFPIWFEKGKDTLPILPGAQLHIVVADTGRIGDTRAAVESIRKNHSLNPIATKKSIDLLGELTYIAKDALINGKIELLGNYMNLAHIELDKLGVSDPILDNLVTIAQIKGALGAKLTGGGRGGCVLALAKNKSHAEKLSVILIEAGAFQTWYFQTEGS